jgi:hypothetical protein
MSCKRYNRAHYIPLGNDPTPLVLVVHYVVPLSGKPFCRLRDLAGWQKLGDVQHPFKWMRVQSQRSKEVLSFFMTWSLPGAM